MTTAPSRVEPVHLGPTWERGEDGKFVLPEFTLGWQSLAWAAAHLKHADDRPWRFTAEQARWWLWWYAVDANGRFLYTQGVLQRLKGWGKDPVAAVVGAVEFVGPSRFDPRGRPYRDPFGNEHPAATSHPEAWVQIAAVSSEQTKNTMRLFPSLFTKATIQRYEIELNKGVIYAHHGAQIIDAVTSNPDTLEGARATAVIKNETHRWRANNSGHEMADVIENNATKSSDGAARALSITNAYEPSEDSVAQKEREEYEDMVSGVSSIVGVMYDSLEAPPDAPLTAEAAPAVIEAIRGDSVWLNIPRLVNRILDGKTAPSRKRRFWYNQIEAEEDSWADPKDWALCEQRDAVLVPGDEVVLFFDGAKSDDATALVACRVPDGALFTLGMWQRPPGRRGELWTAPRAVISSVVASAFEDYRVSAFWADPSHTRDDETQERYWDDTIDEWHRAYGALIAKDLWAVGGRSAHSIMWDMTSPARTEQFVAAAERFISDVEATGKARRADPFAEQLIIHDGDGRMRAHVRNAKKYPTKYGVSLWKGHRESKRKIDVAVCAVGARMLRRLVLNSASSRKPARSGRVW